MRSFIRFLDRRFPRQRPSITIKTVRFRPYDPWEHYMRGAADLYEVERRMRDLAFLLPMS